MEEEVFYSGYCRQLDQTRTVLCEYVQENGARRLTCADCCYPRCDFAAECPIAAAFAAPQPEPEP